MADTSREADVSFIESLAALVRESDLTEIEVTREVGEGQRLDVRLSRAAPLAPAPSAAPAAPAPASSQAPEAAAPAEPPPMPEDPAQHPGAVTSPMVGTAYLLPEPGAAPFVAIGDAVQEGQTLMIVEAMKTMNHIPAPVSGMLRRVLVEDGAPVEYGAPLMIVE